ncbi:MAG: hypothetical protein IJ154_04855 [Bacteroidales bacterium]|nr:hypothetical protein [Bacteroidales bacterium]
MNMYRFCQRLRLGLTSRHRHGLGVHSPFAYRLITDVLEEGYPYYCYEEVEDIRSTLSPNVRRQCLPWKQGRMLFRMSLFLQPENILEVGRGDGVTAQYLQRGCLKASFIYMDQVSEAAIAAALQDYPCRLAVFYPSLTAEELLRSAAVVAEELGCQGAMVVLGIHDSPEKYRVWQQLAALPGVHLDIEAFDCGWLFFREELPRQSYCLRW